MSNSFFSKILNDEIELSDSELPEDVRVAGVKGKLEEDWFWLYLTSDEFVDIDPDFDHIPELTIWFGPRRNHAEKKERTFWN